MNFRLGCICFASLLVAHAHAADDAIRGFPPAALQREKQWEEKARGIPEAARIGAYMKRMSLKPHLAGTPASKAVAEYALHLFKSWGLDAHLEEFEALLPTPKARLLEIVGSKPFRAKLTEPPVAADPTSSDLGEVPPFNAYSGSADVIAPLVYANYGMPGDYEYLAKNGVDVKGKIVLTRYGGGWRGLKPRLAAEHGAIGCLIYSDPKDDGYYRGDVFPRGMWRPSDGVQRGSVMDMTLYPGDPLSPGYASEKGSKRLALSEARTLMKIPVLPISYGDALPLLQQLGGAVAPDNWRGALGVTYHLGDGAEKVHLKVEMDNATHAIFDVIATIPGSDFPDEWVLAGNHHDAWVHGAMDPLSGASALLETARALGELSRQGWKPKRTIVFALWDAEEFGLIGSTEFVEKHADELSRKLVVYINSDTTSKGQLEAGGSHTLESFVSELTRDVNDPVTGKPLAEKMRSHVAVGLTTDKSVEKEPAHDPWRLDALGSGSDYTSFLQHLGIASLNFGFGDENGTGGIYHSAYDSYYWYTHFSDTNFLYGKTLSAFTALSLMRLGNATLLPFQFIGFADTVAKYADEIEALQQKGAKKVDLSGVREQVKRLAESARSFETSYYKRLPNLPQLPSAELATLNAQLFGTERAMLLDTGLPRRDWFKHSIYAPGSLTGYGVKTLPGIREAVDAGQMEEAQKEANRVSDTLRKVTQQVTEAARILDGK